MKKVILMFGKFTSNKFAVMTKFAISTGHSSYVSKINCPDGQTILMYKHGGNQIKPNTDALRQLMMLK